MFLQSFGRAFNFVPEMLFSWYLGTFLYCVLQFAAIGWFTRRGAIRSKHLPRAASDATWYLPVYLWGIESEVDVLNVGALDGFPNELALVQPMMLLVTLTLCLAAESWARRRGWVSRAAHASLPLPVVAAIVSVEILWTVLMTPPFNSQGVSNDYDGPAAQLPQIQGPSYDCRAVHDNVDPFWLVLRYPTLSGGVQAQRHCSVTLSLLRRRSQPWRSLRGRNA